MRQVGQRAIFCPAPLCDGVTTISGSPARTTTRSASIRALSANDAPVSRWHQRRARHPIANRAAGAAALEGEASWIFRHDLSSVGKVPARFTSGMLARLLAPLAVPELHALPLLHPLDR